MTFLAMIMVVFCGMSALVLYTICARAQKEDQAQLKRLRDSLVYQSLREKLTELSHYDIDQLRIECSGVTVTSVCPAHTLLSFSFKQNGNSVRNDAFTRLYAELITQDFPLFVQRHAYKLCRYKVYRTNGKPESCYAFVMRRGFKDFLLAERCPAQLRIF